MEGGRLKVELAPDGNHYLLGKKQMPRVTHVLRTLKLVYVPDDPAAQQLGQAVHLGIRYVLEGRLDRKSVDPLTMPRLEAAEKFVKDMGVTPLAIEKPVASDLGYAGTPDLVCTFGKGPERAVVDFKCSTSAQAAAGLQLVAYAGASSTAPNASATSSANGRGSRATSTTIWARN